MKMKKYVTLHNPSIPLTRRPTEPPTHRFAITATPTPLRPLLYLRSVQSLPSLSSLSLPSIPPPHLVHYLPDHATTLRYFQFYGTYLTGQIPSQIGNLVNMETCMYLMGLDLTGTMPTEFGNMAKMFTRFGEFEAHHRPPSPTLHSPLATPYLPLAVYHSPPPTRTHRPVLKHVDGDASDSDRQHGGFRRLHEAHV